MPFGISERLKNAKLQKKLRFMTLLTGLISGVVSVAILSVFVWLFATEAATQEATVKGAIVAENVLPALQFRNQKTASEILHGFSRDKTVRQAHIIERDGNVFAEYHAGLERERTFGILFDDIQIRVPILDGPELLGEIELRIGTKSIWQEIVLYVAAIGLATLVSLLIGGFLVSRLQREMTTPLAELVRLMQSVSSGKGYEQRADIRCDDEIGDLAVSFNHMIAQIQQRDEALGKELAERQRVEVALRAAKAKAETADNAKSRFLAAASHDLRQPLSALNLYIDVLRRKVPPDNQPVVANMKDCIGSLSDLLADLLDLSKLDAGVVTPNVSTFPINDLLATLISTHAPDAFAKGLRVRCAPSRLLTRTDPVLFRRMLGNLLANAIRYSNDGGVLIGCRRRQGKYWVEVWDTGVGIPADKTVEIFEEFKQLDDGRNRGSGLGLAIVAKTAGLLGLQIRVRSSPGRGSMFAVEMPPGEHALQLQAPALKHRLLRIALVEDNASVRHALTCALGGVGHTVVAAATSRELRPMLNHCLPDIVVADYRLAGAETGFDVITWMRSRYGGNLPAIIVTGDTDPRLTESMVESNIAVQHKPLEIDSLLACIARLTKAGKAETV